MRLYTFLLVSLLLAATVIYADDDEQLENEGDDLDAETSTTTLKTTRAPRKTKRPMKVTPSPKVETDDYPQCQTATMNGRPGYLCERTVDGEKNTFGIQFEDDNTFYCGEMRDEKINGHGAGFYLGNQFDQKTYCGTFLHGMMDGEMAWYFYKGKSIELGVVKENIQQGPSVSYYTKSDSMTRFWSKDNVCTSRIDYYSNGEEKSRDAYSCK